MKNIKWLWVIVILGLLGCAHVKYEKDLERLSDRQKLYMKAIRWQSYNTAATVIRFRNPARRLASLERLDNINVTSYDLISSIANEEDKTAEAQVLFEYIKKSTGRSHKLMHKQEWWLDSETNQWYLDSDMPNFK